MEFHERTAPMARVVSEVPRVLGGAVGKGAGSPSPILSWVHPEWEADFPWLAQGTTGKPPEAGVGDFGLFRESGRPAPRENWEILRESLGFSGVVHARQIHGGDLHVHPAPSPGLWLGPPADGHLTSVPGVLLAVTVADCVPLFLVDPETRSGSLLHAGWRGTAAGILEEGVGRMGEVFGTEPADLHLHLGPAICGMCYEVGPEVHEALGLPVPAGAEPVDLRLVQLRRAVALGIRPDRISLSGRCTRCMESPFYSHRGGDPERQVGYLGVRP